MKTLNGKYKQSLQNSPWHIVNIYEVNYYNFLSLLIKRKVVKCLDDTMFSWVGEERKSHCSHGLGNPSCHGTPVPWYSFKQGSKERNKTQKKGRKKKGPGEEGKKRN